MSDAVKSQAPKRTQESRPLLHFWMEWLGGEGLWHGRTLCGIKYGNSPRPRVVAAKDAEKCVVCLDLSTGVAQTPLEFEVVE